MSAFDISRIQREVISLLENDLDVSRLLSLYCSMRESGSRKFHACVLSCKAHESAEETYYSLLECIRFSAEGRSEFNRVLDMVTKKGVLKYVRKNFRKKDRATLMRELSKPAIYGAFIDTVYYQRVIEHEEAADDALVKSFI